MANGERLAADSVEPTDCRSGCSVPEKPGDTLRSTYVYTYGLPRLLSGAERVEQQIGAAHRYYNALIELEHRRVAEIAAVQRAVDVEGLGARVAEAERIVGIAAEAVTASKVQSGSRRGSIETVSALMVARQGLREARQVLREARRVWRTDPEIVARYEAVTARAAADARALRATCGVYWGTYLLVEAAVEQAIKDAAKHGQAPRFRSWSHGEGRIGVQCQGGVAVGAVVDGHDTRLRLAPVTVEDGRPTSRRYDPARGIGQTTVSVRVGSTEAREPVWATWAMVQDRPLPAAARIKRAVVVRRVRRGRDGPGRWCDELQVTLEGPVDRDARVRADRAEAVAVDIGWRRIDDGEIRVASWVGSDGRTGEYRLGAADHVETTLAHADGLKGILSQRLEAAVGAIADWRDRAAVVWPESWPARMRERLSTLRRWRSPWRLQEWLRVWQTHRFDGDDDGYERLRQWWAGDVMQTATGDHGARHVWQWESDERATALRRRREYFRNWSAELARAYRTVVLEQFDLRPMAASPAVEASETEQAMHARAQRVRAATGVFRATLGQAVRRRGGDVMLVPAANTTRDCSVCGHRETWDQATEVVHTCSACGETWDQDASAAVNLLAQWRERCGDLVEAGGARGAVVSTGSGASTGGRWQRRKAAKEDRSQDARQDAQKTAVGGTAGRRGSSAP